MGVQDNKDGSVLDAIKEKFNLDKKSGQLGLAATAAGFMPGGVVFQTAAGAALTGASADAAYGEGYGDAFEIAEVQATVLREIGTRNGGADNLALLASRNKRIADEMAESEKSTEKLVMDYGVSGIAAVFAPWALGATGMIGTGVGMGTGVGVDMVLKMFDEDTKMQRIPTAVRLIYDHQSETDRSTNKKIFPGVKHADPDSVTAFLALTRGRTDTLKALANALRNAGYDPRQEDGKQLNDEELVTSALDQHMDVLKHAKKTKNKDAMKESALELALKMNGQVSLTSPQSVDGLLRRDLGETSKADAGTYQTVGAKYLSWMKDPAHKITFADMAFADLDKLRIARHRAYTTGPAKPLPAQPAPVHPEPQNVAPASPRPIDPQIIQAVQTLQGQGVTVVPPDTRSNPLTAAVAHSMTHPNIKT